MEEATMSLLDEADSSAIFLISRDTIFHGMILSVTVRCYHISVVCGLLSIKYLCQPVMITCSLYAVGESWHELGCLRNKYSQQTRSLFPGRWVKTASNRYHTMLVPWFKSRIVLINVFLSVSPRLPGIRHPAMNQVNKPQSSFRYRRISGLKLSTGT